MPQLINRLDALKVRRTERPGYYADGAGLYLRVSGGGARFWIFRFIMNDRTRDMGLGSVATFSLAEARQAALEARKLQAAGIDPIEHRKAQRAQERARDVKAVTFRQEAEAYIDAHRSGRKNAKHAEQWRSTLEAYVYERQLCTYAYILEQRHGRHVDRRLLYWTAELRKQDALMVLS